jgi:hypothetical protein
MLSLFRIAILLFAVSCFWCASAQDAAPYVSLIYFNDSTCTTNSSLRGSVVYLDRACEEVDCAQVGTTDWYQHRICPTPPYQAVQGWVSVWQYGDEACSTGNITRILTGIPTLCFIIPEDPVFYAKLSCGGETVTADICTDACDGGCSTFTGLSATCSDTSATTPIFSTGFGCAAAPTAVPTAVPQTTPTTTTPPVTAPVAQPVISTPSEASQAIVPMLILISALVFCYN